MNISKYNSEGYADLTAYQALKNIEEETKAGEAHDYTRCKFKKRKKSKNDKQNKNILSEKP